MVSKILSTSALALLAARLAVAQTYSDCNPVEGDTCPDDSAFPTSVSIDFTEGESSYFEIAEGTTLTYDDELGAVFTISKETDAPTITSYDYIFFGVVDVVMRAAPGTGIVSSIVLESDCLDEIDWEWLGGENDEVQTNYFHQGNTTSYDRGGFSNVTDAQGTFHTYTIDWTAERINWIIDGVIMRTLTYDDAYNGKTYPQTPMQLKLGTWDGGASTTDVGTVEWAGGYTNFSDGTSPYLAYYQSVKITNYSNNVTSAASYTYEGTTGDYQDITVNIGNATDGSSSSTSSESSSSTTTASSSSSTSASSLVSATASSTSTSSSSSNGTVSSTSSAGLSTSTVTSAAGQNTVGLYGSALAVLAAALALM